MRFNSNTTFSLPRNRLQAVGAIKPYALTNMHKSVQVATAPAPTAGVAAAIAPPVATIEPANAMAPTDPQAIIQALNDTNPTIGPPSANAAKVLASSTSIREEDAFISRKINYVTRTKNE